MKIAAGAVAALIIVAGVTAADAQRTPTTERPSIPNRTTNGCFLALQRADVIIQDWGSGDDPTSLASKQDITGYLTAAANCRQLVGR